MLHKPLRRNLDSYSHTDLLQESVTGNCKDALSHTRESLHYISNTRRNTGHGDVQLLQSRVIRIAWRTFTCPWKLGLTAPDSNQLEKQVRVA